MGGAVFPPCCLTWGQTMAEVMKLMVTSFKRSHACTATLSPPTLQQATTDPHLHWRLLDTHGQVWVSLFGGHCSFLLGPSVHKVLFVPSKSLFPQSCVSTGGSMVGLIATSSKRAYAIPRSAAPRAPAPNGMPLLTCTFAGDTQTQFLLGLWVQVRTRFVWALWLPLVGKGFDSKRYFAPARRSNFKDIQPVNPKGNQSWIFIGRTHEETKTPVLWPPHARNWLIS